MCETDCAGGECPQSGVALPDLVLGHDRPPLSTRFRTRATVRFTATLLTWRSTRYPEMIRRFTSSALKGWEKRLPDVSVCASSPEGE